MKLYLYPVGYNVLYISYDGMTDPLGQSQVLPYLRELSKEGFSFHLISFEKPERYQQNKQAIQQFCEEAGISWYPQQYRKKPPVLSTLRDIRTMRKLAFDLHRKHYFHLVHCRSYISAMVGLRMKKRFDTPFLFDMRGFWADERVEGGIWDLSSPVYRIIYNFFKRKESEFLEKSDHIISLTERARQELVSRGTHGERITVIPCCADLNLFNPENVTVQDKQQLRNQLGISDTDFVLGYVGSIGTWYMLEEMLDYFSVLQTKQSSARFLFVSGEKRENIVTKARERGINPDHIIVTSCSHDKVPLHISVFDLSIFFIRPTYSKMASSPTKQGELMAMQIPLVCNSGVGDTDNIVQKYHAGQVITHFDEKYLADSCSQKIEFDPEETARGAQEVYSLKNGVLLYKAAYGKITPGIISVTD